MTKALLVVFATAGLFIASTSLATRQAAASGPQIYTAAQATAGAKTYSAQCSKCHGDNLEGVSAPALRGDGNGLKGDSVGEAYTFISTQMPAGNPGSLSGKQYADILAFILSKNGFAAGPSALTADSAKKSKIKV
jgi:mono/diheme cytochrome c family protein